MSSSFKSLQSLICLLIFCRITVSSGTVFSFDNSSDYADGKFIQINYVGTGTIYNSTNRIMYSQPIQLWDPDTNSTTNFTTYFEFLLATAKFSAGMQSGGFAFFLAAPDFVAPIGSAGGWLGLFNETIDGDPSNHVAGVEFDTFRDRWDPSDNHVGIDVNSIVSKVTKTWNTSMTSGETFAAQISYSGTSKTLGVHVKDLEAIGDTGSLDLAYKVDLREILPRKVVVGFSASSGSALGIQRLIKWNFTSSFDDLDGKIGDSNAWLLTLEIVAPISIVIAGAVAYIWYIRPKILERKGRNEDVMDVDDLMEDDFQRGTGPKQFSRQDLLIATNNFSAEGKLGEGGFGAVYRGFLKISNQQVAVKRISRESKQGRKEYVAEVKIISRLRHRNLVQLIGWSHEGGEFLLAYEFMPNGSLDSHLFMKRNSLAWEVRYRIAHGLALALLYLHEEWEQCVVHRDVKSSNVVLDSDFNAKLGDFGLARLVDHRFGMQTTAVAGTYGYMAPECLATGKASKESDVFSFGIVALEIATGRRAVDLDKGEEEVRLVEWVWGLYGRGKVLAGADRRLGIEFNARQMECLMRVGLWCAHPDHSQRPSMRQVVQALNFDGKIAELPKIMPVPTYAAPRHIPVINSDPQFITSTSFTVGR